MKIHNKSHVCPVCGHAFAQLSFLNKHIQKHQEDNDGSRKDDIFKNDDVNENAFKCDWKGCLFRSKYRNVLKRHIDTHHPSSDLNGEKQLMSPPQSSSGSTVDTDMTQARSTGDRDLITQAGSTGDTHMITQARSTGDTHMITQARSTRDTDLITQAQQQCPSCLKLFDDRIELRNHMFDKHNQVLQV